MNNLIELFELSRLFPHMLFALGIKIPNGDKIHIRDTCYLECIQNMETDTNLLIIKGGITNGDDASYVRLFTYLVDNVRIFTLRKDVSIDDNNISDIRESINFIKNEYGGRLIVMGFSIGGTSLFSYLSKGYDEADYYIPVCCTYDIERFTDVLRNNTVFKNYCKFEMRKKGYKDLDCIMRDYTKYKNNFEVMIEGLNKHTSWLDKTHYVYSNDDPFTKDYVPILDKLKDKPYIHVIFRGWHCGVKVLFKCRDIINDIALK